MSRMNNQGICFQISGKRIGAVHLYVGSLTLITEY